MHGLYKSFYNMCCNSNIQTNNSLSINEKCNMDIIFLNFMNAFDIPKKCYKLACIDNMKT